MKFSTVIRRLTDVAIRAFSNQKIVKCSLCNHDQAITEIDNHLKYYHKIHDNFARGKMLKHLRDKTL